MSMANLILNPNIQYGDDPNSIYIYTYKMQITI